MGFKNDIFYIMVLCFFAFAKRTENARNIILKGESAMTKRILSMLLALSIALSVCPVSAFADTGGGMFPNPAAPQTVDEQNDLLSTYSSPQEHSVSTTAEFNSAVTTINADTSCDLHWITLNDSIEVTDAVTFEAGHTVKIIGKGKTITFSGNGALKVSGAELALSNVFLDGQSQTRRAPGVTVESGGTLKMEANSCIQNFTNSASNGSGGGVYVGRGSTMTMNGGTIKDCSASDGGGIYAAGTVVLNGGTISGCKAVGSYRSGGGIYIGPFGSLTMGGGSIESCTASNWGGGVYAHGTFELTGGTIKDCSASYGGGVFIAGNDGSILEMKNGSITGCEATGDTPRLMGGGVYINNRMTMTGGSITGCKADVGGGIYNYHTLALTGGTVCNNTAQTQGADIYLGSWMRSTSLLDAAAMGQTYGTTGSKIDGWYEDASGARYTPGLDGTPVDVNTLTPNMALVASYRIPSTITVNGGTASVGGTTVTKAKKGETVTIKADPDTEDVHFAGWDSKSQGVSFDDKDDRKTTFVMPGNDVEISTIKAYHVAVTDGTASPDYAIKNKDVVLTYTGAYDFVNWQVDGQDINGSTFAMPGHAVKVTPVVNIIPQYTLTVNPPEGIAADAVTVTVGGNQVKSAAEGVAVSIAFNASALPADGSKTFGEWVVADAGGKPVTVKDDGTFTMPASNVVVSFTLKDAGQPDNPDTPSDGGSGDSGAGGIVAGALLGTATYLVGTHAWLHHLYGFIPQNRIQLALALWKLSDCPQPESTALYPDIDEDDDDAQAAARWCVEQGLMKDYHKTDKDGNEEVTFKPYRYVFRPQAIKAWYDLEKLLNEQPQNGT